MREGPRLRGRGRPADAVGARHGSKGTGRGAGRQTRPPHARRLSLDTTSVASSLREGGDPPLRQGPRRRSAVAGSTQAVGGQSSSGSQRHPVEQGTSTGTDPMAPRLLSLQGGEEEEERKGGQRGNGSGSVNKPLRHNSTSTSKGLSQNVNRGMWGGEREQPQLRGGRAVAPKALDIGLLQSTTVAAAAANQGNSHSNDADASALGEMGGDVVVVRAAAGSRPNNETSSYRSESDVYSDVPFYQYGEQLQLQQHDGTLLNRTAALQPIVTEEWARSMIKPGEEYLLYARHKPSSTSGGGGGGYGGVSLDGKRRRGASAPSASSAAAGRQIEEAARRRQATAMALAADRKGSNARVFRSSGTGLRATSYGSTVAASLGRAPTENRSSLQRPHPQHPSVSMSLARSVATEAEARRSGTTTPPPEAATLSVDEPYLPPRQPSLDSHQGGGGGGDGAAVAYCRVPSPVPNPAGGYHQAIGSLSPPPTQLRADSSASVGDRNFASRSPSAAVGGGVHVRPDARVMRRRSMPMLFTQPTPLPSLFHPQSSVGMAASSYGDGPGLTSATTTPPTTPTAFDAEGGMGSSSRQEQQQQRQALRRQSASEYELLLHLRARMLSQLAEAKSGGRVSTEAYPRPLSDGSAAAAAPRMDPPPITTSSSFLAGRPSVSSRRRPDISVSLDTLRPLAVVERETQEAAAAASLSTARAPGIPSLARAKGKPTTTGRGGAGAAAAPQASTAAEADEATARLLADPFFPLTSEENFERLLLCNQEYLSRKKLNDRRQLLNYYAAASSNAPLPPSLLSSPSDSSLLDADEHHGYYPDAHPAQNSSSSTPARPVDSSLGRDISTSVSQARPAAAPARGNAARPIQLKGGASATKTKKTRTKASGAGRESPPPPLSSSPSPVPPAAAAAASASGAIDTGLISLSPPDILPLSAFTRTVELPSHGAMTTASSSATTTTAAAADGEKGRRATAADSKSDASRASSSLDNPLHAIAPPRRVSFGSGNVGGGGDNNSSFGSRSSPSQSPARHAVSGSPSPSPNPHAGATPPPQAGSSTTGTGGNSPVSSTFLVNAVMPTAKTGPIAPLSTSNMGYTGGGGSRPSSTTSSRCNSVTQLSLPAALPSSSSAAAASGGAAREKEEQAQKRLLAALASLVDASTSSPSGAEDLREFIPAYRRMLVDEGYLVPAASSSTSSSANNKLLTKKKGGRWQGTAAGPFMLALRRQILMEECGSDEAAACVEPNAVEATEKEMKRSPLGETSSSSVGGGGDGGGGQPKRQGLHKVIKRKKKRKRSGSSSGGLGEGDGAAIESGEAPATHEEGDETASSEDGVVHSDDDDEAGERKAEEDAFLASLDDSSSHQRNVRFILNLFGAFMNSPSAGLSDTQQQQQRHPQRTFLRGKPRNATSSSPTVRQQAAGHLKAVSPSPSLLRALLNNNKESEEVKGKTEGVALLFARAPPPPPTRGVES